MFWASLFILSFQVLTMLLMTIVWMMRTDIIIGGTALTMRSVPMRIASRRGHHLIFLCFERYCEDFFICLILRDTYSLYYSFWEILFEISLGTCKRMVLFYCSDLFVRLVIYIYICLQSALKSSF